MKKIMVMVFAIWFSSLSIASEVSEADSGTYELLNVQDMSPTGQFFRLSKQGKRWVMEGKKPGAQWENITCDTGCEYRTTTKAELNSYFQDEWRKQIDFSCIQNKAGAFCRAEVKSNPPRTEYLFVALVTGQPILMNLRRVKTQ